MKDLAVKNLKDISELLSNLTVESYIHPCPELSNATIGQHIRHILEFFECLREGYSKGIVNYDSRRRNSSIETCPLTAISIIENLIEFIDQIDLTREVVLQGNWSISGASQLSIATNYTRELVYNIEHSIHHQALVRVGMVVLGIDSLVNENFGVAAATIRFRQN